MLKRCSKCKEEKSFNDFYSEKGRKYGLSYWCKSCRNSYSKSEKVKQSKAKYFSTDKGKAVKRKYSNSDKGKIAMRKVKDKRRAPELFVEFVERRIVYERDGWTCQLCLQHVDGTLKFPERESSSLDHVIPLKHGGKHSYENTQLAHLSCNIRKGFFYDGTNSDVSS